MSILACPSVLAAPGMADIYAKEDVEAREASATFEPLGFFSPGVGWEGASISCATLRVTRFYSERVQSAVIEVPLGRQESSYTLTDAVGTFQEVDGSAWLGAYPTRALALTTPTPAPRMLIRPEDSPVVGNSRSTPEPEPLPDQPSFGYAASGEMLEISTRSALRLEGPLMLKLSGSLVHLRAAENQSTLDTRDHAAPTSSTREVRRWAFLECDRGTLVSANEVDIASATPLVEIASAHDVATRARRGMIEAGAAEGPAEGDVFVRGAISGRIASVREGDETLARLTISGDFTATSLAAPASPVAGWWPWTLLALGMIAGAGTTGILVKRRSRSGLSADQYAQLASQSAEAHQFAAAAEWIDHALALAQDHPRLLADKGYYLAEAGLVDEALSTYRRAAELGDSESKILLARLLTTLGGDPDEATRLVCEAMEADPVLALEVQDDEAFTALMERSTVRGALAKALRRIDG